MGRFVMSMVLYLGCNERCETRRKWCEISDPTLIKVRDSAVNPALGKGEADSSILSGGTIFSLYELETSENS